MRRDISPEAHFLENAATRVDGATQPASILALPTSRPCGPTARVCLSPRSASARHVTGLGPWSRTSPTSSIDLAQNACSRQAGPGHRPEQATPKRPPAPQPHQGMESVASRDTRMGVGQGQGQGQGPERGPNGAPVPRAISRRQAARQAPSAQTRPNLPQSPSVPLSPPQPSSLLLYPPSTHLLPLLPTRNLAPRSPPATMGILTTQDKEKIKRAVPKASNKIIDATVAQLYVAYPDHTQWTATGLMGAVALVDDLVGHTFFLKLVDITGARGVVWDQELYVDFQYHQDRTFFHTFETDDCLAGLLFEDTHDAAHFHKRVAARHKHASRPTANNKNAVALKDRMPPPQPRPGNRGEYVDAATGQRTRRARGVLYYDGQPPPEWRLLYAELAAAGISEDMIAENRLFIKEGAGVGMLKKTDKSLLEKPSVLLQEARGEPVAPAGGAPGSGPGGQPETLADALATRHPRAPRVLRGLPGPKAATSCRPQPGAVVFQLQHACRRAWPRMPGPRTPGLIVLPSPASGDCKTRWFPEASMGENVLPVLQALEDALSFWAIQLSAADADLKDNVPAATVEDPLQELVKITKLIRAHTTKVGIIYEPSKLRKLGEARVSTVADLSKSFVLFLSALAQLSPGHISQLFYDEIRSAALSLVVSATSFAAELKGLYEELLAEAPAPQRQEKSKPEVDPRLVSVGKIWSLCDGLTKLVEGGKLKALEKKTKMHLSLIEDGLDEFADWAENPQDMDDEDPFGLEDDFSDDEDELDDGAAPPVSDDDDGASAKQISQERNQLVEYSKVWLQKFKLVKLLFLSINKSLSNITSGHTIDQIVDTETVVAREIDTLIVELMLNQTLDDVVEKHAFGIDNACFKIIAMLRDTNKKSEAKVKWCASWESKYKEFLGEMYK
ncbi:WH1-domain-containing protein [Metschnikowia bicuspidata var. bicuspidata NRRL YB-4993]|uniref:WH1-domain-containing protein n=1 Tax=Metschnikowia bicuspidata var. bicuspidata NRRL YB-4993 TaxID=869754 RepID=A0A1A0H5W7_9ASCO|nr:WH1-domain-containing protein [Metschnikowia bicuspidata var. bicuspidata NRRL YB-4993]OBA19479.1 WH1-domain-containing protein [Metschnikowia bicuspidata var. bicuspidata NRRL YB-4993]